MASSTEAKTAKKAAAKSAKKSAKKTAAKSSTKPAAKPARRAASASAGGGAAGKSLVIVESPAKARTIERYLGEDFKVCSSVGHIRDLPVSQLGVDIEKNFEPTYETIRGKGRVIQELQSQAKAAKQVYLAPDPDREGEAIAWHIATAIEGKNPNISRVTFNEITARAVREAIARPAAIDMNLVNSQQARRVLDRLVGYQISPLLWKKVQKGLSAGRVQSVAVRLIVEREREIQAFVPEEYWSIEALVEKPGAPPEFVMKLAAIDGAKFRIGNEADARAVVEAVRGEAFRADKVIRRKTTRRPYPPFITSTLQQEAARKLRFTARQTMRVAQQLYEGVEMGAEGPRGLITYMRTDSTRISQEAQAAARALIAQTYGARYVPESPNVYSRGQAAQDAHEAIRPTSMDLPPDAIKQYLEADQLKLYTIIWNRFLASQMAPAEIDQTRVEAHLAGGKYIFAVAGSIVAFPGFLAAYEESKEDNGGEDNGDSESKLPPLAEGDALERKTIEPLQHFTQPPPRYSESSLVKELETQGIGRPSTYAQITQTIQDREYVEKDKGRFKPTERGFIVTDILIESFPEIMDVKFTAEMESQLDHVEEGSVDWVHLMGEFYGSFKERLDSAQKTMRNVKAETVETDIRCDKCGEMMVVRWGRRGRFLACSGYPGCRNTKPCDIDEAGKVTVAAAAEVIETDEICDKCGAKMAIRTGRMGRFLACTAYPNCSNAKPVPIGVECPAPGCEGQLVERMSKRGSVFFGCNRYPKCRFVVWERPRLERCQQCDTVVHVFGKRGSEQVFGCAKERCPYEQAEAAKEE